MFSYVSIKWSTVFFRKKRKKEVQWFLYLQILNKTDLERIEENFLDPSIDIEDYFDWFRWNREIGKKLAIFQFSKIMRE